MPDFAPTVIEKRPAVEQRTIVVVGIARGGTSMVASALHHLGVPMGDIPTGVLPDYNNYECQTLFSLLEQKRLPEMERVIEQRNAEHTVWGWKSPRLIHHPDFANRAFRNPHFVFVFRDSVAIWQRQRHHHPKIWFKQVTDLQAKLGNCWDKVRNHPRMLVSYERAVRNPDTFLQNLCDFISWPAPTGIELHNLLTAISRQEGTTV